MKALVVFYSTYGHIYQMAEAVAEGVKQVSGAEVELRRVPETCLLYTSPSPRDRQRSRMPSSA